MGLVRASVVVEFHPPADTHVGLRPVRPDMQIDTLVFQRLPHTLDEDVVQIAALALRRDTDARSAQAVCSEKRGDLGPLIAVHDVGRSDPIDDLVQSFPKTRWFR